MLTQTQVTALLAQARSAATYASTDADGNLLPDWQLNASGDPVYLGSEVATRGLGIYGQSPESLTLVGFLKPGTLNLITSPGMTITVLNTPSVWSGQYGINSVTDYLNSPILQNLVQVALMSGAYQGLIVAGVFTGNEDATFQAAFVQPAARYGVTAVVNWVNGALTDNTLLENIKTAARQGIYAIDFLTNFSAALAAAAPTAPGAVETATRTQLDTLVAAIIGNAKIPNVVFSDASQRALANVLVQAPKTTAEDGVFRLVGNQLR